MSLVQGGLILSMHAAAEYVYRALRAGAAGYLVKDDETAEVATAIRTVHAGKRYLSKKITDSDDIVADESLRSPLEKLSLRERQILQLIVESKTSAQIANMLALSVKMVDTYRSRLTHKLGMVDLQQLVKFAIRHGLISLG